MDWYDRYGVPLPYHSAVVDGTAIRWAMEQCVLHQGIHIARILCYVNDVAARMSMQWQKAFVVPAWLL